MKFAIILALVCIASAKTLSKTASPQGLKSPLAHFKQPLAEIPSPSKIPYSFAYNSDYGNRQESSDGNAVRGSYSVVGENGQQRVVNYVADKDGFRAAISSNEFSPDTAAPAHVSYGQSVLAVPVLKSVDRVPVVPSSVAVPTVSAESPIVLGEASPEPYAFEYNSEFGSRKEKSDGQSVLGYYTLAGDNGQQRIVNYIADKDGFRAAIATNEFGTENRSPADVAFVSSQPSSKEIAETYGPLYAKPAVVQSPATVQIVQAPAAPIVQAVATPVFQAPATPVVQAVAAAPVVQAAAAPTPFAQTVAHAAHPVKGLKTVVHRAPVKPSVAYHAPALKTPVLKAPAIPAVPLAVPVAPLGLKAPALPLALPVQRLEQSIEQFDASPQKLDEQISEMYEQQVKRQF